MVSENTITLAVNIIGIYNHANKAKYHVFWREMFGKPAALFTY